MKESFQFLTEVPPFKYIISNFRISFRYGTQRFARSAWSSVEGIWNERDMKVSMIHRYMNVRVSTSISVNSGYMNVRVFL